MFKKNPNPQTIGLIRDLGKRMWRKQLETFFRHRSCKWGAGNTHPFHIFLWCDVCYLTCEDRDVGATKMPQTQWYTVADAPAVNHSLWDVLVNFSSFSALQVLQCTILMFIKSEFLAILEIISEQPWRRTLPLPTGWVQDYPANFSHAPAPPKHD